MDRLSFRNPVKRARALKIGAPSTRDFGFARDGVIVSARVAGVPNARALFSRGGVGVGTRNLLRCTKGSRSSRHDRKWKWFRILNRPNLTAKSQEPKAKSLSTLTNPRIPEFILFK